MVTGETAILLMQSLVAHGGHHHAAAAPTLDEVLRQWEWDWTVMGPMLVGTAIYVRGWWRLRTRGIERFVPAHLYYFLAAMGVLYIALQSPIDPLADDYLLSIHMVQHLLLWFAVPLLVWLSEPFAPFVFGLPKAVREDVLAPLMRSRRVRGFFRRITHPVAAWLIFVVDMWAWHLPAMYDLALHYETIHRCEHLMFLITGLIFWWPVLRPYPARIRWTPWLLLPYLLFAAVQGTFLSAIIVFSQHVIYPFYLTVPRITSLTALADQQVAGTIMWIPGSIVYVGAVVWAGAGLLSERGGLADRGRRHIKYRKPIPSGHGTSAPSAPEPIRSASWWHRKRRYE